MSLGGSSGQDSYNPFQKYLKDVSGKFKLFSTSEMGYRTEFETLLNAIFSDHKLTNIGHDDKEVKHNKPDFVVREDVVPILYLEVKDIGISLDKVEVSDQASRYFGYANLVISDYLEFRFYRNGVRYEDPIKVATFDIKGRTITPQPENFERAIKTLRDFADSVKEPIRSGDHLAKIMGGKAQRIRDNILRFMGPEVKDGDGLSKIFETMKRLLVQEMTLEEFADMYAQTLVYGLFVARFYDETPEGFSRFEARELIPASKPFLRHFFDHIVGPDFDPRMQYIVDELCTVFVHTDVQDLMNQYFQKGGKGEDMDPVIHFYEDFLKEYDPELRKKMGAYYTPLPVVRYIIRAVNEVLKRDFQLPRGLADSSKTPDDVHRVQILDPTVGTVLFVNWRPGSVKGRCRRHYKRFAGSKSYF